MDILIIVLIGLIAGWLASIIMRGRGLGVVGDIIIGIIGALIGGLLFRWLGYTPDGFWGSIATATIGAIILLAIISFIRKESV